MGLALTRTLPTGVVIEYWRIRDVRVDRVCNTVCLCLGGYLSRDHWLNGCTSAFSHNLKFFVDLGPDGSMNAASAYALAKTPIMVPDLEGEININPFVDAIDVIEE